MMLAALRVVTATRNASLLIVDDDAPIRKLLERVALRAGFDVDTARDGVDALEKLQKKRYAIAIIDLMMPRLSGYDLVQKISALDPRPVVLVATALTNGDVAKIDDTLVRRVIRKPFDVHAVVESLVETARQIAEEQRAVDAPVAIVPAHDAVIGVIASGDPPEQAEEKQETAEESTDAERPAC